MPLPRRPLLSVACRASGGSASRLSGSWCARRRLRCVCFSCRAGPSTDRSPSLHPRADVREARPSFSPGRPGGRRLSQPLLVWAGPLREPVELCGYPRRVVSARGACSPSGPHSEGRTSHGRRLWSPGSSAGPLPPRRLGAGFGGLAGACLSTCWPSLLESQCPRGGGVAWVGVLAASAAASEEPCMSTLCVQVLSRDPRPDMAKE